MSDVEESGSGAAANHAFTIVPHDTNALAHVTRAIYVGAAGDVKVTTVGGDAVTFKAVPVGTTLHVQASIIWSTGTGASLLVGLY